MAKGKKAVEITETVLRDAHQSLIATRMTTEQILPIVEKLDDIGYHSLEAWGGATFDACLRFLNEDPWERLRKIKDRAKQNPIQMLFRGQNILGYRHYADDIVEYGDTVLVARPENKNVVMISEKEYNSWQETNYLLKSEANRAALKHSIEQLGKQEHFLTPEECESLNSHE